MTAHTLTIEPGVPGGYQFQGRIKFADGTETTVYADERARIIAQASAAIEQYKANQEFVVETLVLDDFGEIMRDEVES